MSTLAVVVSVYALVVSTFAVLAVGGLARRVDGSGIQGDRLAGLPNGSKASPALGAVLREAGVDPAVNEKVLLSVVSPTCGPCKVLLESGLKLITDTRGLFPVPWVFLEALSGLESSIEPDEHDGLSWIKKPSTEVRNLVQLPGTPYSLLLVGNSVEDQELGADVGRLLQAAARYPRTSSIAGGHV